ARNKTGYAKGTGKCGLDGTSHARSMHFTAEAKGKELLLRSVGESGNPQGEGAVFTDLFVRVPPSVKGEWKSLTEAPVK
ncbi:MAG: hypothetical protein ACRD1Z_17110, partial [Vicinamibacteria bacterium]